MVPPESCTPTPATEAFIVEEGERYSSLLLASWENGGEKDGRSPSLGVVAKESGDSDDDATIASPVWSGGKLNHGEGDSSGVVGSSERGVAWFVSKSARVWLSEERAERTTSSQEVPAVLLLPPPSLVEPEPR